MKKLLSFLIYMSIGVLSYSQQNEHITPEVVPLTVSKGTYQFIFSSEDTEPMAIDSEILKLINNSRLDNEDITLNINQNVRIYLPSYQAINNSEFIPLEEFVISNN